ncbi:hypothetical protein OIU78_020520 [Salix suchowensis]|nr:hypothetical protein OIU78_020520 [Salix suchowensis]
MEFYNHGDFLRVLFGSRDSTAIDGVRVLMDREEVIGTGSLMGSHSRTIRLTGWMASNNLRGAQPKGFQQHAQSGEYAQGRGCEDYKNVAAQPKQPDAANSAVLMELIECFFRVVCLGGLLGLFP